MTEIPAAPATPFVPVRQLDLIRERRFWPLFWVQFLGALNDHTFKNAFMALLTYRLADAMGLDIDFHVLLAGALYILPFALVAPTAGQIADGMDKARMMRRVKAAEIVLMGLAALAFHLQSLWLLYALLFLMGAQSAFFAPIKYGVLPQYLERRELVAGNGLVQSATFLAIILGQIMGIKLALTEGGVGIVSTAVVALAVLGWLASLAAVSAPPLGPPPKPDWTFVRAVGRIIGDCRKHPTPFFAILCIAWFWFAGATFLTLILPVAKESLHASEDAALALLATFVAGLAAGSLLTNRAVRGRITFAASAVGALGIGAGAVIFWRAVAGYGAGIDAALPLLTAGEFLARPDAWPAILGLFVMAVFAGLYVTPLNTIYTVTAPPGERGRFVACSNVIDSFAMVFSSLLAMALLLAGLTREEIFAVVGLTGIGAAAALWRARRTRPLRF